MVRQDGSLVADDEHEDGTLFAGIDDGSNPPHSSLNGSTSSTM
jgi:hypothetical protein